MKKGVFVQTFPFVKRESLSEEKTRQKSKSVKRINPSKEKTRKRENSSKEKIRQKRKPVKRVNPSKEKNSSLSAGGFPACHVKE